MTAQKINTEMARTKTRTPPIVSRVRIMDDDFMNIMLFLYRFVWYTR